MCSTVPPRSDAVASILRLGASTNLCTRSSESATNKDNKYANNVRANTHFSSFTGAPGKVWDRIEYPTIAPGTFVELVQPVVFLRERFIPDPRGAERHHPCDDRPEHGQPEREDLRRGTSERMSDDVESAIARGSAGVEHS